MTVSFCIALLVAALAGMGVGGGGLLVIWLTLVAAWDTTEAQGLNLLFFIVSATVASLFHRKKRHFDRALLLNLTLAAIPGVLVGAAVSAQLSTDGLRSIFGYFLMISGVIGLFGGLFPKKAK